MLRGTSSRVWLALLLWRQGVWEALQLQRCIVTFVLDSTGRVLAQTIRCCIVNGLIYLGSIAFYHHITSRVIQWLLIKNAQPVYGAAAIAAWQKILGLVFQLLWLIPLYAISIMVSCIWYQQIAVAAFAVQQQQQHQTATSAGLQQTAAPQLQQQPQQHSIHHPLNPQQVPAAAAAAAASGSPVIPGSMMGVLEDTAQEGFRVLLFLVFTVEVMIISLVPFIGPVLNVVLLSWLYAYYCYDYKWSLQGERLPHRLAFFEAHWAFFAGFGFPCVAATVFFPFHIGAALANLLFPVFILVACASDPVAAEGRATVTQLDVSLGSVPVFKLALRPTYWIVKRVFNGRRRSHTA